ncbi:MAG: hypothetical protein EOS65_02420 [Mesorhizobium sp.]|uniref:hypothetical protein n=1 Tax=Mesorhizobium sp. TaxID=1871066 RepID=UPI000FE927B0|nr:hypothetical protein [Mesorhizobium sp.]RWF44250.1 MAG: hypothetical protein EOS65_02420 [Mesorhizobium sp.]
MSPTPAVAIPETTRDLEAYKLKTYRCEWQLLHGAVDQYGNNFEAYESSSFPTREDAETARDKSATKNIYNGMWVPNNAPHGYCETQIRYVEVPLASSSAAPSGEAEPVAKALDDIAAERQRQISAEGWTVEHDDEHDQGEMALAAACYAYEATRTEHQRSLDDGFAPPMWPWAERWWKPTTRRRDLVKAGALIVAEIERLDRATKG